MEPLSISVAQFLPKISWQIPSAQHLTWFLFWNPAGTVRMVFDKCELVIGQDHAVLIPPCTKMAAFSDCPFSHLYAHFKTGTLFDSIPCRPFLLSPQPARKFYEEKRFLEPSWRRSIYWQLLLFEYLLMLPPEAFASSVSSRSDSRIIQAMQLCEKNIINPPGNAALARKVGMSVNNFYRVFLQEVGIPPHRYKNNLRLDFARKLLQETNDRIPDIAERCGYVDRYQFSKAFKKYFGVTPAAIRRGSEVSWSGKLPARSRKLPVNIGKK